MTVKHDNQAFKPVFFYGLFMDKDYLEAKGLNPLDARLAYVAGYGLRIGSRATLEHSTNERVFGSIIRLDYKQLEILYDDRSVEDYIPLKLVATDMQGRSAEVISYILPIKEISGSNAEYARLLAQTAGKIGLPENYINEIETWIEPGR